MIHISSYHSNGLQPVVWPNKVNLIGEKVYKPKIHFCEHCEKPILIYGRLIPCKHVFCYSCATLCLTLQNNQLQQTNNNNNGNNSNSSSSANVTTKGCHRCGNRALRAERNTLNSIFVCQIETCRRTYLSARDLQAHFNHRHSKNKPHNSNGNSASMVAISSSPYITSSSLMHFNNNDNNTNKNGINNGNNQNSSNNHHRQSSSSTSTTNNTNSCNPNNNISSPNKYRTSYHSRDRERERDSKEHHRQSIQRAAQWAEASAQMLEKGLTR